MVKLQTYGKEVASLDLSTLEERGRLIADMIDNRTGAGNDFLGWLDYSSKLDSKEVERIISAAKYIREHFDCLVVTGIGGSYLGPRAVIEAINGLYPNDNFEIVFFGNTVGADYTAQVLNHLKNKRFAVNVISKSGTTTETAVAFRLLKNLMIEKFGKEYLKDAIYATTDKARGCLKQESDTEGYQTFVIPDDIGGRFSVITPVGLLPIACANIDIKEFLRGLKDGEKDYSSKELKNNLAYQYGAYRYLLKTEKNKPVEMFVTYEFQYRVVGEWLKQLFDESEGKDGMGVLATSVTFTTDLHSMGQFIQDGSDVLFETLVSVENSFDDVVIPHDDKDLDKLNYLEGKKMSYVNKTAADATLKAHTEGHTSAIKLSIERMDAYNIGNLMYFFFRACAFSGYLFNVNPFNQPGVEIYKKNMFKLLGKPGYTDK